MRASFLHHSLSLLLSDVLNQGWYFTAVAAPASSTSALLEINFSALKKKKKNLAGVKFEVRDQTC